MNIVRVTVRPANNVSATGKYVWTAWYNEVPTLDKIMEDVKATSKGSKLRLLSEILIVAKKGTTFDIVKSSYWSNLVRIGGTTVGVIDYKKLAVNVLKEVEMEKYRIHFDALRI